MSTQRGSPGLRCMVNFHLFVRPVADRLSQRQTPSVEVRETKKGNGFLPFLELLGTSEGRDEGGGWKGRPTLTVACPRYRYER
jgi:hypothetical protein